MESFTLPLYPKVGFWKIRVHAEGQIEEMSVKVEKFYLPQAYELVTVMPSFVLDTDEVIEAAVEGYGNTGCGVSSLGIQNYVDFWQKGKLLLLKCRVMIKFSPVLLQLNEYETDPYIL